MDLYAYSQIEALERIASENGIEVPRLRGYRLMRDEKPALEQDIREAIDDLFIYHAESYFRSDCILNASWEEMSYRTDRIVKKYINDNGVIWSKVHGKRRKDLKFIKKRIAKRVRANMEIFNKYCGRSDVLYIHARIGGWNWGYYKGDELKKQPWFLEKVDDFGDSTYVDIYAKIKENSDG